MIKYEHFCHINDLVKYCNDYNIHKNDIIEILFKPQHLFDYILIYENSST